MIVYIMGAGRSGTTALDILLGNQESCFSMGEIRKLFDEQGTAIGRDADDTVAFWHRVYAAIPQNARDAYLHQRFSRREYHLRLVQAFLQSKFLRSGLRDYGATWHRVFDLVRSYSGKRILIDSSKYPGRAMMLEATLDDTAIVYIVRARSEVVRSFRKRHVEQPEKSVLAANLYYCLNRIACSTVFLLSRRKKVRIDFQDLQVAPQDTIKTICSRLDIPCNQQALDDVANRKPIPTGHLFDGNRLRLNSQVVIGREAGQR